MAKKSKSRNKTINYIFFGLVVVGLVLVIVGMFVGQVIAKTSSDIAGKSSSTVYDLFDGDVWKITEVGDKKMGVSNVFAIVSFVVTLVGLAVLLVDGILHCFVGKNFKIVRIVGALVTIVGAILVLVSGLVMAGQCAEKLSVDLGGLVKHTYVAGAGVWLGFVGGLVGGICGGLPVLKAFGK